MIGNSTAEKMPPKPFLSLVVPVFNEAAVIARFHDVATGVIQKLGVSYEIIFVDDGSKDETWKIICRLGGMDPHLKGISFSRNFGKESALSAGLSYALGEVVIPIDVDLQHPPELIPEMIKKYHEGYDIVEGVKSRRDIDTAAKRASARLYYYFMRKLSGIDLQNMTDFKLLSRKVVDVFNSLPERRRFVRALLYWAGFRKAQIPFEVQERVMGITKWSYVKLFALGFRAITSFSNLPLRLVTFLGGLTLAISAIMGIDALYMKFTGRAVSGFTTVIILLLFIGSVLMSALGIIGEYIASIYDEVKNRPLFIVREKFGVK